MKELAYVKKSKKVLLYALSGIALLWVVIIAISLTAGYGLFQSNN